MAFPPAWRRRNAGSGRLAAENTLATETVTATPGHFGQPVLAGTEARLKEATGALAFPTTRCGLLTVANTTGPKNTLTATAVAAAPGHFGQVTLAGTEVRLEEAAGTLAFSPAWGGLLTVAATTGPKHTLVAEAVAAAPVYFDHTALAGAKTGIEEAAGALAGAAARGGLFAVANTTGTQNTLVTEAVAAAAGHLGQATVAGAKTLFPKAAGTLALAAAWRRLVAVAAAPGAKNTLTTTAVAATAGRFGQATGTGAKTRFPEAAGALLRAAARGGLLTVVDTTEPEGIEAAAEAIPTTSGHLDRASLAGTKAGLQETAGALVRAATGGCGRNKGRGQHP